MHYTDGADQDEESKCEIHGFVFLYVGMGKQVCKIIEVDVTNDEVKSDMEQFSKYLTQILYVVNEQTDILEGCSKEVRDL